MALAKHNDHAGLIKTLLLASVVGLHAALLVAILASARVTVPNETLAPTDVRFVEISPDIGEAISDQTSVSELPAHESKSEPEPEPTPSPEPSPEPESAAEPQPQPEPAAEPEPQPQTAPQPEPDVAELAPPALAPEAITRPPPKLVSPKVVPEAVAGPKHRPAPRLKPEPKRQPKPRPKSQPRHKPESKTVLPKTDAAQAPAAVASRGATATASASKPASNQPRVIGKVDYLGRRPQPSYPRISMRRGETGRVVVRVLISRQGLVEKATVRVSSGFSRLDDAAVEAVRTARFKPYTENGVPYPAIADIPFDFVL